MCRYLIAGVVTLAVASVAWGQVVTPRQPAPRPAASLTLRTMNQRLPEVGFRDTPFDQVVDFLADLTKVNFVVRWQTLEDAGVKRDSPINLQARNLRLSQILWLIMNEAGGSDLKLAYRLSGNLLVLSTEEDLGKEMVTKVYDIADLLLVVRNADTQGFDLGQSMGSGGQGGGGGQSLFGGQNQRQDYGNNQPNATGAVTAPQMQALLELIQNTVEPDTWASKGGTGTVYAYRTLLVIRNTILVHQRLGGYVTEDEVGP